MKRASIITGIDVGTSAIRVVVATTEPGKSLPTILAMVQKESRGLRHGYVTNSEEAAASISEALAQAERAAKVKIKQALLAVGGMSLSGTWSDGSVAVSRADSEINNLDVTRAINASEANLRDTLNRRILHSIPQYFKLDGKKILGRPQGLKGTVLEARTLFISCLSQHLEDLEEALDLAGVGVEEVVAAPLAESFAVLTKLQKTAGCVLANIGAETVSIAVFEDGIPVSLQVFPIGSTDITNDIALGLKISLAEAETIKRGGEHNAMRKRVDEIIDARLSDIFELIEAHLKRIGKNGLLPAGIVLTGGGAETDEADAFAKSALKLPASVARPRELKDPSWSVAYGLCLMAGNIEPEETLGMRKLARQTTSSIMGFLKNFLP